MKDVVYSGKKEVWLLKLKNGKEIKATKDHKIMTKKGWVELGDLTKDDEVMCDTLHPQRGNQKSFKMKDAAIRTVYHPYKNKSRGEVEVHRLIYESYLNKLAFKEFLDIIWNDKLAAKKLKYINPKTHHIHHKDENHYNNDIKNLELLEVSKHLFDHSKRDETFHHFYQGIPCYNKVKSVNYVGCEDTYDIICDDPHHNFVANGMIVHNSGKTTFATQLAKYLDPNFNLKYCVFTPDQFDDAIENAEPESSILWDEAITGANISQHGSKISQQIISKLTQIRKKRLKIILCFPYLYMLNKYFVSRCIASFYIYAKDFDDRGYVKLFSKNKTEVLYNLMKERYRYNYKAAIYKVKAVYSRFPSTFHLPEDEYDTKKEQGRKSQESNKEDKWKSRMIDTLTYLRDETDVSQKEIAKVWGVQRQFISGLLNK